MQNTSQDLRALVQYTLNETQSPVLLPYPNELINHVVAVVERQSAVLAALKHQDDLSWFDYQRARIMEVEIAHYEYYLTVLAKRRLEKVHAIARAGGPPARCTPEEHAFLTSYRELRGGYVAQMAGGAEASPSADDHVFARTLRDSPGFVLPKSSPDDPEEVLDLLRDEIVLFPFAVVEPFLNDLFELV